MKIENLIPNEPIWLQSRTILLGRTGSHAYGTATKNSDLDYKGIFVPPLEYFFGLQSYDGYDKTGGKTHKNQAGDIDVTLIHINKFVRDAIAGVPNNLELLFLDESDYIYVSEYGRALISIREQFLSKQIIKKFGGYAKSQAQKMKQLNSNGAARSELVDKYGYDTKFYMHTIRLLEMAIEILTDGVLTVKRKNAAHLLSLLDGIHTLDEALIHIEELERRLVLAYEESSLPEQPNLAEIDKWLVEFNIHVSNGS